MSTGYIKLYRRFRDSPTYQLPPAQRCVFLEVLLSANWKRGIWLVGGQSVPVETGEFITSYQNLASRAGVSKNCVRRALRTLQKAGTVTVHPARQWTRICVMNYERYQGSKEQADTTADTRVDPRADRRGDTQTDRRVDTRVEPNRRIQEDKKVNVRGFEKDSRTRISCPKSQPAEAIALARKLTEHIRARSPNHRELKPNRVDANQERWANDFRLAHTEDERDWAEMARVLDWSQRHEFWQSNIMSGGKFRTQFDTLKSQMGTSTSGPRQTVGDLFGGGDE